MSNKINVGDIIELKQKMVKTLLKNIGLLYTKPSTKEFCLEYSSEVMMLLASYLKMSHYPIGKVLSYGARTKDSRYLMVNVKNKFGRANFLPVLESDIKLKERAKKRK